MGPRAAGSTCRVRRGRGSGGPRVWVRKGRDGMTPEQIAALRSERDALREAVAQYETLAAILRRREQPWIAAWQRATGRHDTLPDYDEVFDWITTRAERAESELADAKREAKTEWESKRQWMALHAPLCTPSAENSELIRRRDPP